MAVKTFHIIVRSGIATTYNIAMTESRPISAELLDRTLDTVRALQPDQLLKVWRAVYERLEQIDEEAWEALPGSREQLETARKELESGEYVDLDEYLDSRKAG